jgi:hypothetical protein
MRLSIAYHGLHSPKQQLMSLFIRPSDALEGRCVPTLAA